MSLISKVREDEGVSIVCDMDISSERDSDAVKSSVTVLVEMSVNDKVSLAVGSSLGVELICSCETVSVSDTTKLLDSVMVIDTESLAVIVI